MALGRLFVLILLRVLFVHGEIYLYNNTTILFMFDDYLSEDGPGIPFQGFEGFLRAASPADGCTEMVPADRDSLFVIIKRYGCTFEQKVRNAQAANFSAVIVHNVDSNALIHMPYTNKTGILIPAVFVSEETGELLLANAQVEGTYVWLDETFHVNKDVFLAFCMFVLVAFFCMLSSMLFRYVRNRRRRRRYLLPPSMLKSIPKQKYDKNLNYETCVICQENFNQGDVIRILHCSHAYHAKCIDVWLTQYKRVCAVCKRRVLMSSIHYSISCQVYRRLVDAVQAAYHAKCIDVWLTQYKRVCAVCKRRVLMSSIHYSISCQVYRRLVDAVQAAYHAKCIDVWLTQYKRVCAVCKRRVLGPGEVGQYFDSDSESEPDDRTPLLRPGAPPPTTGGTFASLSEAILDRRRRVMNALRGRGATQPPTDTQVASSSQTRDPVGLLHSVNAASEEYDDSSSGSIGGSAYRSANSSRSALSVCNGDVDSVDFTRSTVSAQSNDQGDSASNIPEVVIVSSRNPE
ncbi:hypothetical protein M8J77_020113 [Diaphorina citri]|nr:hypothetical protein M8J77_020113 [Diaphorina citri]KAI5715655.1 hypothetical protein M8J77_020113 [Diaphorina citri]KAI5715656.1 hypothetical protein M8J77_020113 [Diaphorina citri]KAI5715657.1 hypothetical protein M8J77_020113 [Diaphorina citri]